MTEVLYNIPSYRSTDVCILLDIALPGKITEVHPMGNSGSYMNSSNM